MVLFSLDFFLFSKSFQNIWFYSKDHISWYEKTIVVENMQRSKLCVIPGRVHRKGKLIRMISFIFAARATWLKGSADCTSKQKKPKKKTPKQTKKKRVFNCGHLLKVTAICHYRRALRSSYICRVFAWWCNACVWLCKTMWTRRQWHLADIKYWIIYDVFSKGLHVSLSKLQPTHCLSNRHPWDATAHWCAQRIICTC